MVAGATGTFYGVSMTAGDIYTVAGDGTAGSSGDGGFATSAELSDPQDVAVDAHGNLVIADSTNNRIQVLAATSGTFYGQLMTADDIYTVAGTGATTGCTSTPGPATSAVLNAPSAVAVDSHGNLVIAETGSTAGPVYYSCVRVVAATSGTFYGVSMTAGDIYTVAGDATYGYSGDGGGAASAELNNPGAVTVDSHGNLIIADSYNNRVRVVAVSASNPGYPLAGCVGTCTWTVGDIYTVAGNGTAYFSGDGGPATSAELSDPAGVAIEPNGNLVIADEGNFRIRVVANVTGSDFDMSMTAGDIYTVAGTGTIDDTGDGGLATSAEICEPTAVGTDNGGDILVVDCDSKIRMVSGSSGVYFGNALTAGDVYTVAGDGTAGYSGGVATAAELDQPGGVTVDADGNLVISDTANCRIRVVAQTSGTFYGVAMTTGHIYTVAGTGTCGQGGMGGPATSAKIDLPEGIAVDGSGNLVFANTGTHCVIKVVAATSGTFYGRSMTADDIYDVAGDMAGGGTCGLSGNGGPALSAKIDDPQDVAVDGSGNLVIADTGNSTIRVVADSTGTFYGVSMTAGDIYRVAGNNTFGYTGDTGSALSAELANPTSVAVDAAGNLVFADVDNYVVRVVAESTGTYYGVPMTAGDIYAVAGDEHTRLFRRRRSCDVGGAQSRVGGRQRCRRNTHQRPQQRPGARGPGRPAHGGPREPPGCGPRCRRPQPLGVLLVVLVGRPELSAHRSVDGGLLPDDHRYQSPRRRGPPGLHPHLRRRRGPERRHQCDDARIPRLRLVGQPRHEPGLQLRHPRGHGDRGERRPAHLRLLPSSPPWWCSGSGIFCATSPRVAATLTHNCSPVSTCTGRGPSLARSVARPRSTSPAPGPRPRSMDANGDKLSRPLTRARTAWPATPAPSGRVRPRDGPWCWW